MKKDYTIKQVAVKRWFYAFTDKSPKGETIVVELTECHGEQSDKRSIPYLWKQNGFHDTKNKNWLGINTYVTDKKNNCLGIYNPQISIDGQIEPDWILEATDFNKQKIIDEIYRLANA